jgi:Leucine-rich repeat (LRR) protein
VEKSYVLMLSILEKSQDLKFSKSSFEVLRIHIWLTPLLEYAVEQYLWSDSLIVVSSLVSNKDSGLVEHLLEPAIYICISNEIIHDIPLGTLKKLKRPMCHTNQVSHIAYISKLPNDYVIQSLLLYCNKLAYVPYRKTFM